MIPRKKVLFRDNYNSINNKNSKDEKRLRIFNKNDNN